MAAEAFVNIPFVDVHCHLLPGIDDGAKDLEESLAMARLAVADGISTIVCTPHQCGNFSANHIPCGNAEHNDCNNKCPLELVSTKERFY